MECLFSRCSPPFVDDQPSCIECVARAIAAAAQSTASHRVSARSRAAHCALFLTSPCVSPQLRFSPTRFVQHLCEQPPRLLSADSFNSSHNAVALLSVRSTPASPPEILCSPDQPRRNLFQSALPDSPRSTRCSIPCSSCRRPGPRCPADAHSPSSRSTATTPPCARLSSIRPTAPAIRRQSLPGLQQLARTGFRCT